MKGKQNKSWGTDANDIPVREAFEWARNGDAAGSATWYRDTGAWWTDRYARDRDGISVEEEERDSTSLLSFYRKLLTLRRGRPELVSGEQQIVDTDRPDVLAVRRSTPEQASLLLVNLSDSATTVGVQLLGFAQDDVLKDLLSGSSEALTGTDLRVHLPPFGVKLVAR
jgi:glycosidase